MCFLSLEGQKQIAVAISKCWKKEQQPRKLVRGPVLFSCTKQARFCGHTCILGQIMAIPLGLYFLMHTSHFPSFFPGCLLSRPTFLKGIERGNVNIMNPIVIFIESEAGSSRGKSSDNQQGGKDGREGI